jgi:amino acid transporter
VRGREGKAPRNGDARGGGRGRAVIAVLSLINVRGIKESVSFNMGCTLFALVNGALINMVMASRLLYGMAQQGVIPRWFGSVHAGRRTPRGSC